MCQAELQAIYSSLRDNDNLHSPHLLPTANICTSTIKPYNNDRQGFFPPIIKACGIHGELKVMLNRVVLLIQWIFACSDTDEEVRVLDRWIESTAQTDQDDHDMYSWLDEPEFDIFSIIPKEGIRYPPKGIDSWQKHAPSTMDDGEHILSQEESRLRMSHMLKDYFNFVPLF